MRTRALVICTLLRYHELQDVVMPEGGDGLDLLESVQAHPVWRSIPVVSALRCPLLLMQPAFGATLLTWHCGSS